MAVFDFLSQFTPANLLAMYLVLMIFLSIALLVQALRSGQERLAGLYAVSLVGWVSVFSLITGFSIGWFISIVNILIGILLFVLIKAFRIPVAIGTLISILLALSLRGTFFPAWFILSGVLGISAITSVIGMIIYREKRTDEAFSLASLSLIACLAGIAFYFIPHTPSLSRWIAVGTVCIGGILVFLIKHYRVNVIEIVFASLLCFSIFLP